MTKLQLVSQLADELGMSKREAKVVLNAVLKGFVQALETDQHLMISGFGTFAVRDRRERKRRNPQSGATVLAPAYRTAVFRPSDNLKQRLTLRVKAQPPA